jgi:hypothetical protein
LESLSASSRLSIGYLQRNYGIKLAQKLKDRKNSKPDTYKKNNIKDKNFNIYLQD